MIFQEYNKYKSYYKILESWEEIEFRILSAWMPPISEVSSKTRVKNALFYMFYKYKDYIFAQVRGGQLTSFYLIKNANYHNPLTEYMRLPGETSNSKINSRRNWIDTGGVIRPHQREYTNYQIVLSYYEVKNYLLEILRSGKVPDLDLIINTKERLVFKKDGTEASEELVGSVRRPLQSKFQFSELIPVIGFNWNERYTDLAIPTPDDINRIFKTFCPPSKTNSYLKDDPVPWSKKKYNKVVFRGSLTGSSFDPRINQRLHIAEMSRAMPELIDAGITSFKGKSRYRKSINSPYLESFDSSLEGRLSKPPISMEDQKMYKYVAYVEGNTAAYRGAYLFSFGSVVLWVEPMKYKLWFENMLKDRKNCIFIKPDLSNLKESIEWLRANDRKAAAIAAAGVKLYRECLTRKPLLEYGRNLLSSLNPVSIRSNYKDAPLLIVVPFGDLRPEEDRLKQLNSFIDHFKKNTGLLTQKVRVWIVIAEQVEPKTLFNRGLLLNYGIRWFVECVGNPRNMILHDVDILPDAKMMGTYLNETNAARLFPSGNAAYSSWVVPFGGAVSSIQHAAYKKINGYPNDFWGWGGEDNVLSSRANRMGINIVDLSAGTYKNIDSKRQTSAQKTEYLKKNNLKNMRWWEAEKKDVNDFQDNGYRQAHQKVEPIGSAKLINDKNNLIIIKLMVSLT